MYALNFDNDTGDLKFYNSIVDGLSNGCGLSIITSEGECSPIVGHFFPGFFYLLRISYSMGLGVKGLVVIISIFHFLASINLSLSIKKYCRDLNLSKSIFLLTTISPLTFGWSRLILMEPLITSLGIFFIAQYIKIFYEGFNRRNLINICFIQIVAIYFKPTAILFTLPLILLMFNKLNVLSFLKLLFIWLSVVSLLVMPWGIRNISFGAKSPFTSALESNFFPKYIGGYSSWLKSWVITEHEQAQNGFPVNQYPRAMNLNIQKANLNPFIKEKEIQLIQDKYKDKHSFTKEDDQFFKKIAQERTNKLGLFGNFSLYSLKTISLLMNPINSWGWPLEIKNQLSVNNLNLDKLNINKLFQTKIIFLITLKLILFIYRGLFFAYFANIFLVAIKKNKFRVFKSNSLSSTLALGSFIYLLGILYLIVIRYPSLEHRYISMAIPWFEVTSMVYFFKLKEKKINYENQKLIKINK